MNADWAILLAAVTSGVGVRQCSRCRVPEGIILIALALAVMALTVLGEAARR